jgi:hypothetical protein
MSLSLKSGSSSNVADVDLTSKALRQSQYDTKGNKTTLAQREVIPATQEYQVIAGKNDQFATAIRTDRKGNLMTGNYLPEIVENFEGATNNVQKWTSSIVSFAQSQTTNNGFVFNSGSAVTASAVSILQSQRVLIKLPRVPLQLKVRVRANIPTNSVADWGFGIPSSTTLIVPNGCAIRVVNGLWFAVITYNNVEISIANILTPGGSQLNTANLNNEFYVADIIVDDDNMVVTVQNTETGAMSGVANIGVPLSASKMWGANALPIYARLYNTASSPATAPNLTITELQALSMDWNMQYDASQMASHLKLTSGTNPFTGAPLTTKVNSTVPPTITLSNASSTITQLDGVFLINAIAGAETDYIATNVTIPLGSRFVCEGVKIDVINTGVAVTTTPTVLEWSMGFNASGASLATANIVRKQVGIQSFLVGASVGAVANTIDFKFATAEPTESGRVLTLNVKIPIGTATASEVFKVQYNIQGRFI